jgi:hypothetical protein
MAEHLQETRLTFGIAHSLVETGNTLRLNKVCILPVSVSAIRVCLLN